VTRFQRAMTHILHISVSDFDSLCVHPAETKKYFQGQQEQSLEKNHYAIMFFWPLQIAKVAISSNFDQFRPNFSN